MRLRIASVTLDSHDPWALSHFWSAALEYRIGGSDANSATAEDPNDRDVELVFVQVPEGKTVKNRVHLDLGADDREAEVRRLQSLGATVVEVLERWTVMRDPEGNEFCIVQADQDDPVETWRQ